MGSDSAYGEGHFNPDNSMKSIKIKKSSKIEKLTEKDYQKAKRVTEKYRQQLRNEIKEEQKNCKHKSFYRYWYDEDHLFNVCRTCFHEWEEKYRPFLLGDYPSLTQGEFKRTEEDLENLRKYRARLESINEL